MTKICAVFLLLCAAGTLSWARGTMTYYVAPGGEDSNDGSKAHPFATIQKAADVANPGDTVIVKDGVYTDTDGDDRGVNVDRSGTADKPITFKSEHKWGAVLDGKDFTVGFGWDFGKHASYIVVEGFEVRRFRQGGIWSNSGAHHITIRGNHVHHIANIETTTQYGLNGAFDGREARYHVYDGNVFHDIGRIGPAPADKLIHDHGIYTCGSHHVITNNIFYNCNAGWDIQVAGYKTVDDLVISNNVFAYGRSRGQIVLWLPCHNILIQNNIFYKPAVETAINFYDAELQNVVIRNNLVFGGALKDADDKSEVSNNIEGKDPQFVDIAKHDFRLKPGSPAIGAGIADRAPQRDFTGRPRPQGKSVDIGAYER